MQVSDAYWAGFFDGEGCVTLMKYVSKINNEKFVAGVRAVVVQKETKVLHMLQSQFGGVVLIRKNGIGQWQCGRTDQVLCFFKAIHSYLLIKDTEVSIAIELLDLISKSRHQYVRGDKGGFAGKAQISLEEIKKRQHLQKLMELEKSNPKKIQLVPTLITEEPHV